MPAWLTPSRLLVLIARLLSGIPQEGTVLGKPSAPVTLVEYADLQCPYCALFATDTLPTLVTRYVRPGNLKIEFRGLAFLGPDSGTALRAVVAAGAQNRLWNVLDLLYRNQGSENSGWVTDDLVRSVGESVPGLDVERMLADRSSASTTASMQQSARQAEASMGSQVRTPTFEIGRSGSTLQLLNISSLDPGAFAPTIDALLGR
jgi:protein-disulfide isomerase